MSNVLWVWQEFSLLWLFVFNSWNFCVQCIPILALLGLKVNLCTMDVNKDKCVCFKVFFIIRLRSNLIKKNCNPLCMLPSIFNPFNPNSDQHQISPCNIKSYLAPEVMRIKDMITQSEFSWYFNNFSPVLLRKVWGQDRRICSLRLEVKGLKVIFCAKRTRSWMCLRRINLSSSAT